ncbi:MAG: hypothetical protein LBQ09_01200 [Acidobacteriaceae bacterium]|jgi:autotransporter translocation and assembly factor TamB|nr:hypothetical protein [Acidobacteriaceae bacterium]
MRQWTLRCVSALALVGCLGAPALAQTGLSGAWALTIDAPTGANTVNLDLTLAGDKVSGTMAGPMGEVPVTGQMAGAKATFSAEIDIQGMALHLDFSGALENGAFNGQVKVGDLGEFPFTGKRRPAASASMAAPAARAPSASAAGASPLAGAWDIVITIEGMGDMPGTVVFTVTGQKVAAELTSMTGTVSGTGTFDGTTLRIETMADTPQGQIPIVITGTLTGGSLSGNVNLAGMIDAPWKGTKK